MEGYDTDVSNAAITTVPVANATQILFDSTADPGTGTTLARRRCFTQVRRVTVTILADQAVTFFFDSLVSGSTTWDTVNGSGSGEATTANTFFERDCFILGDDFRLKTTTTTAPTVWRVSVRLSTQRARGAQATAINVP